MRRKIKTKSLSPKTKRSPKARAEVAIIMGSDSDLPTMSAAVTALDVLKLKSHVQIVSAHRTPEEMIQFAKTARGQGYKVIIAGAGGAAHLPGMVAAVTSLPVIGVPVEIGSLQGVDALLSIAQMPKGVPVACMSVGGAFNAGLLAARILAVSDPALAERLADFQLKQKEKVQLANSKLRKADR